jgi:flagellin-like hook-associated protein FlgL
MAYGNITLTSGMRQNLVSLQKTNSLMEITQTRLASGKKVNTALDDPVKYFAALGHTNRAGDLAARKSEMGEGIQTIKAANNGIEAIVSLIDSAKSTAQSAAAIDVCTTAASQNATDRSALADQFDELLNQIDTLAADSGYKGINLLASGSLKVEYDERGDSFSTITGFAADANTGLGIVDANAAWLNAADVTTSIDHLDTAKANLRSESQTLSSSLSTITTRQDFTKNMINTLEDGASDLVNADMNEEGANMLMLQTRQALGTTSLSLASQAAQSVLRLF